MKSRPLRLLAQVAIALLLLVPAVSALAGVEIASAEAAIRKADAEWAAVAGTGSVDAWMSFYAADPVVMAPNVEIARDHERVRQTVSSLLALPHLAITWRPIKVEVAASGDLAYLIGAYELSYDEAAVRIVDQGKLLEIWRKQPDGRWKCIVDTWNSDGPATAAHTAPAVSTVERGPTPGVPGAGTLPSVEESPIGAPPPAQAPGTEYGAMPKQYEETVRQYFQEYLKDPDSVQYREITMPEKGYAATVTGALFTRTTRLAGWNVSATINARNSRGAYVGFKTYSFLFRGEKIVHTVSPLPEDEMK